MRGSFSYEELLFKISVEDREIINNIIKQNVENTTKTKLPLI